MLKRRLYTPGPTEVPERVLKALSMQTIYHRSEEFKATLTYLRQALSRLFKTDGEVIILTSSGTGAMEAAVAGLFDEGDTAVVVEGGKFGQRWGQICQAFKVKSATLKIKWGSSPDVEQLEELVKKTPEAKGILVQICETSTGTYYDIKKIGEIAKKYDKLLIADGITAFGVYDIPVDEWGIDVAITGSQKALMTPPGLSVLSLSERALRSLVSRGYYFNLQRELKAQKKGQTAYTPAVNLFMALSEALKMMEEEGFENVFKRHERLASAMRAGVKAMGLSLFSENPANSVTAVKAPEGINGQDVVKTAKELFGVTIAGGQEHLKGKIFRLSHMGYVDILDVISQLVVVGQSLAKLGFEADVSAAVDAAFKAYGG